MPSKNRLKEYQKNSYYHIYNRGTEKRHIFQDQQDYSIFLTYLRNYLVPKDEEALRDIIEDWHSSKEEKKRAKHDLDLNNFSDEITLLAYCLMPNHFHFLIKQKGPNSIDKFMNSLGTRYTMYFNKKYKRVGSLYQGVYKASMVFTDDQLLKLSKYIHKQALAVPSLTGSGQPSSYPVFINKEKNDWVTPQEILDYLTKEFPKFSYKDFINDENDWDLPHNVTRD